MYLYLKYHRNYAILRLYLKGVNVPNRVALYARVSTPDQSVAPQLDALRQYALNRGVEAGEYVDDGISGAKNRRPALDRMLSDTRRRRLSTVVVVKLDRLGRSLRHLLTVLGELEELGVSFVSLDDGIDTSTSVGRLFMQIRGAFAEYELALIRERTRAGVDAARRRGARFGRPEVLSAEQRARAHRLLSAGRSQRYVASLLDVGKGTIQREALRLRRDRVETSASL